MLFQLLAKSRRPLKMATYSLVWMEGVALGLHMLSTSVFKTPLVSHVPTSATHAAIMAALGAATIIGAIWIAYDFFIKYESVDID